MQAVQLSRTHRILVGVVVTGAVVIAAIGFAGSYAAVRALAASKGFGAFAPFFPIGIDAGIMVLLALDLLLTWIRIPFPLLRQTAWLLTAATIAFNGAAAWPDPLGVGMHAVIPVLFVVSVEAARHAIGRIADITADRHMEGVRVARWLLAFPSTFRLWRRMKLWELRSYDQVIRMEQDRLVYEARLRARFGRGWRRKAPVEALMPLRLARYGVPLAETGPAGLTSAGITEPLRTPALPGGAAPTPSGAAAPGPYATAYDPPAATGAAVGPGGRYDSPEAPGDPHGAAAAQEPGATGRQPGTAYGPTAERPASGGPQPYDPASDGVSAVHGATATGWQPGPEDGYAPHGDADFGRYAAHQADGAAQAPGAGRRYGGAVNGPASAAPQGRGGQGGAAHAEAVLGAAHGQVPGPRSEPAPTAEQAPLSGEDSAAEPSGVTVPVSPGRRRSLGAPGGEPEDDDFAAAPVGIPDGIPREEVYFEAFRQCVATESGFPTARQLSRALHDGFGVTQADGSLLSERYLGSYLREFRERYKAEMGLVG